MKKLLAMATMVAVALGFAGPSYCWAADAAQPKTNVAQKQTDEQKSQKTLKGKRAAKKEKKVKKGRKAKKPGTTDAAPKAKKTETKAADK